MMSVQYNISVPMPLTSYCETKWEDNGIQFEHWGAGHGTAEYSFPDEATRNRALELGKVELTSFETEQNIE